jgi:hypothetical protein
MSSSSSSERQVSAKHQSLGANITTASVQTVDVIDNVVAVVDAAAAGHHPPAGVED